MLFMPVMHAPTRRDGRGGRYVELNPYTTLEQSES